MIVKIDFEDTYEPIDVAEDLSFMHFNSINKNGGSVLIRVKIKPLEHADLPNVSNLSFGPPKGEEGVEDTANIHHQNSNKVFSTILLFCLTFLQQNRNIKIGLDGSNEVRAYLYHRMFISNREYLNEYFVALGVDWYVKLLRNGDVERDDQGIPHFKPKPEPFDYTRTRELYRYYMFVLREGF